LIPLSSRVPLLIPKPTMVPAVPCSGLPVVLIAVGEMPVQIARTSWSG
jgi:hypothetical protein